MPTVSVNLDTTQYVQVNTGLNPLLLQAHRDAVRVTLSDTKPAKSNTVFHIIGREDPILQFNSIDVNVWALSTTDKSSLIVSETGPFPVISNGIDDDTGLPVPLDVDIDGVLSVAQPGNQQSQLDQLNTMFNKILKELRIMNLYNAMAHNEELTKEDIR